MTYLVEFEGARPAAEGGGTVTLRFADGLGFATGPDDSPPNTVYPPRLLDPGTFERHAWKPGRTRGQGEVSVGTVELANRDGALDALFDYAFDGRPVLILRGEAGAPRRSYATVFRGTLEHLAVDGGRVLLRLRDRQAEVAATPLVTTRYAGDNVLPAGTEGTAGDLKGLVKPVLWGEAENVSPPRVNSSLLVYQISSRPIAVLTGVYEGGNAIAAGVQRANLAALMATAPTAGQYDYSLGSGAEGAYFRLGSLPSLQITATAAEGTTGTRTVGQTIARVLAAAGIAGPDIASLPQFDARSAAPVGWWAGTDEQTTTTILDALAASAGAAWFSDRDGAFRLARLEDPAGLAPVARIEEWQMLGDDPLQVTPTADDERGVPPYEVALAWGRNYTPMSAGQVAGAVAQARRDFLSLEYRTATVRDPAIWDPALRSGRHPLSQPLQVETQLRLEADATAEARRLLALYGQRRRYAQFPVTPAVAAGIDLGEAIEVVSPRFGFAAGRRMLVIGLREELAADRTTIFCWG